MFLSHIFSQTVCRIHGSSRKEKKDKDHTEQDTNNAMSNVSIGTKIFLHQNRGMVSNQQPNFVRGLLFAAFQSSKKQARLSIDYYYLRGFVTGLYQ